MAEVNEYLAKVPGWIKAIAISIATLAAGAGGWASLGWPIPMTVDQHAEFHEQEAAVDFARLQVNNTGKALRRLSPGDEGYDEAEEAYETACAFLRSLNGESCD